MTSGLDPTTSRYLLDFVSGLKKNGNFIVRTNNLEEFNGITRWAAKHNGRIIDIRTAGSLFQLINISERMKFAFFLYLLYFLYILGTNFVHVLADGIYLFFDNNYFLLQQRDIALYMLQYFNFRFFLKLKIHSFIKNMLKAMESKEMEPQINADERRFVVRY